MNASDVMILTGEYGHSLPRRIGSSEGLGRLPGGNPSALISSPSLALEQHRDPLTTPDAEANEPEFVILAFHLV